MSTIPKSGRYTSIEDAESIKLAGCESTCKSTGSNVYIQNN